MPRARTMALQNSSKSLAFVFVLLSIRAHLENSNLGGTLDVETILVVTDLGGAANVYVSAGTRSGLARLEFCFDQVHEAQVELETCSKHPQLPHGLRKTRAQTCLELAG